MDYRLGPYENGHWDGLEANIWYRVEYKIQGGGTSSGTIETKIDGVDRTSDFEYYANSLDDVNGLLTLPELNYISLSTYDKPNYGHFFDITGLKVTDGPDWIGGDILGDLTGDGLINIQDIQACVNHILAIQDWGSAADINDDDAVNVLDVQEIVNLILSG